MERAALPDNHLSHAEKWVSFAMLGACVSLLLGMLFIPEIFWDDFLEPVVWEPISRDASDEGDAGYTPLNTAIYATTLLACVVVFSAIMRIVRIPCDDRMMIALIAWVILAPVFRVLEDADFFTEPFDILMISPVIHFHLAGWLLLTGLVGWIADNGSEARKRMNHQVWGMLLLLMMWALLFQTSTHEIPEIGKFWIILGMICSVASVSFVTHYTDDWDAIPRQLLITAVAGIILGLGYWMQLGMTPWEQESGNMPKDVVFWPVLVVLGIPGIICWYLYKSGIDDLRQLRLTGNEPGVLPEGIQLKWWEENEDDVQDHPIEMLSGTAILATPMVLGMVYGQICDGLATFIGLDFFDYSEKHPVSQMVIDAGDFVGFGQGAWLFALVKAALVTLIVWVFAQMRVESRQQHMRMLIVLAVLIVGLAPGIRDIGRLMLGV